MPLVALSDHLDSEKPRQSVLVFSDGDRSMGLMVDEIVDVVEDRLNIELSGARPGLLGSAVIAGFATDVIDTGYWLTQASHDWFHGAARSADHEQSRRVLVVEDSDFFRQLVTPILGAALSRHRGAEVRPRRCACGRQERCSMRSCRTSRCQTWTGSTSPVRTRHRPWARRR
jgi:two-component system chemotaxis sensor kinase CheA